MWLARFAFDASRLASCDSEIKPDCFGFYFGSRIALYCLNLSPCSYVTQTSLNHNFCANVYTLSILEPCTLSIVYQIGEYIISCHQNTNDHRPLFANPLYHVEIYENITTGTTILQLSAQDRDNDDGKTVLRYSIVSGNSLERFFIDAFSGVIYVKSPIDRDPPSNESSFLLTVAFIFY